MLLDVNDTVPGKPRVEDMPMWDKVAYLLNMRRFAVSLEDLAMKHPKELAKQMNLQVEQVMQLKLLMLICEDYHSIKEYRALQATESPKVAKFFQDQWQDLEYEKLVMLFCDENRILEVAEWNGKFREATYGAPEVVRTARAVNAKSVIVVHNHPFGTVKPSAMDLQATKTLMQLGFQVGFEVSEHIIVGKKKWYSFKSASKLTELMEELKQEQMKQHMDKPGWD